MADAYPQTAESQQPEGPIPEKPENLPSLKERTEWVDDWEEKTHPEQELAKRCRRYVDGDQYTKEEINELENAGRPVITKNRLRRKVNFLRGEEIKKRVDPEAKPRNPKVSLDGAKAMTDALRFVEEQQEFDKVRSEVFFNVAVEGIGGAIKGIDPDDDYKHELTHIEYDRLMRDPHSRRFDFSDARWKGINVWRDLEDAIADYPDKADELRAAVENEQQTGTYTDTTEDTPRLKQWAQRGRKRVKIAEMYFRWGKDQNWYRADFTKGVDLRPPELTAYFNEKRTRSLCPLLMTSCYVDRNGLRHGVVKDLLSPQDEVNHRSSKYLHEISAHTVLSEKKVVEDPYKMQTELAKSDGFYDGIVPGGLVEGRMIINPTAGKTDEGQYRLLQEAKADIDGIGPSSAQVPELPESASGRAFIARQQAASQESGVLFDHIASWTHDVFRLDYCCVRQFWDGERWIRVTDGHKGHRFVALNRQMTRAQRFYELTQEGAEPKDALEAAAGNLAPQIEADTVQQAQLAARYQQQVDPMRLTMTHPLMQEPITLNQVDQMDLDIIVTTAPDTAVLEQEEFAKFTELMPVLAQTLQNTRPDLVPLVGKTALSLSQLRVRDDILEAWDKPPPPPPPEQQQAQAQQQAMVQAMQQAQLTLTQMQSMLTEAKAEHERVKAQTAMIEAQAEAAKVPSEISKNEAQADKAAADAGKATVESVTHGIDQTTLIQGP